MYCYRPYVIRQGDYLAKLAYVYGFDADEVWNHRKNAALRSTRSPNLLYPGEVLHIPTNATKPGLRISSGTEQVYRAKVPTVNVHLVFKDGEQPLANEPCEVFGCVGAASDVGVPLEMTLDGLGGLSLRVSVLTRRVEVYFGRTHTRHVIHLGAMDPLDTSAGEEKRLQNLGYFTESLMAICPREQVVALAQRKFAGEYLEGNDYLAGDGVGVGRDKLAALAGV